MSIPAVRSWRAMHAPDGYPVRMYHVLAPTRRLALLNLRFSGVWGPVKVTPWRDCYGVAPAIGYPDSVALMAERYSAE
jgi:hypothetical protein